MCAWWRGRCIEDEYKDITCVVAVWVYSWRHRQSSCRRWRILPFSIIISLGSICRCRSLSFWALRDASSPTLCTISISTLIAFSIFSSLIRWFQLGGGFTWSLCLIGCEFSSICSSSEISLATRSSFAAITSLSANSQFLVRIFQLITRSIHWMRSIVLLLNFCGFGISFSIGRFPFQVRLVFILIFMFLLYRDWLTLRIVWSFRGIIRPVVWCYWFVLYFIQWWFWSDFHRTIIASLIFSIRLRIFLLWLLADWSRFLCLIAVFWSCWSISQTWWSIIPYFFSKPPIVFPWGFVSI